jgi:hypothetical protein
MSPVVPAVTCDGCGFTWNSPAMAEGLRALGECPKCAGVLAFAAAPGPREVRFTAPATRARTQPHLVLGIPRR